MSWLSIFAGERDPNKRKVKPVEQPLFDLDLESSDDSDFNPEEHKDGSDDSLDSNDEGSKQGSGSDDSDGDDEDDDDSEDDSDVDEGENSKSSVITAEELQQRINSGDGLNSEIIKKVKKKIQKRCWGCLGDSNDDFDELVECDSCGVTVHEKCYGMSDSDSLASVDSSNPDLPWFCDACRAGVKDPPCELCPNSGGIFKETDVGRWVHLVCALYIPGLFPSDGEKLSLFKMPYAKYGAKLCTLCEDERLARTGVCIECDAGMCRTYFHASCAQKMGLLQEAHPEETETVDKFYAHCKLHSDKTQIKRRRQNFILLQERLKERNQEQESKDKNELERIQRKFRKACSHFLDHRTAVSNAFIPPSQKMPRALITSATACRLLWRKGELAGLNTQAMEIQETQIASLKDVNRKWHIPASFSVEFIAYFLDRVGRITKMKKQLQDFVEDNARLLNEQKASGEKYEQLINVKSIEDEKNKALKAKIKMLHGIIQTICPKKNIPAIESIGKPHSTMNHFPQGVPTAAALKAFPMPGEQGPPSALTITANSKAVNVSGGAEISTGSGVSSSSTPAAVLGPCGKCHQSNDPHLLAHCDNCKQYYHLGCLNPPLTRMPKKTKLFGWQCSECDKESSGSDVPCLDPEAPRKLRRKSDKSSLPLSVKSDGEASIIDTTLNSSSASIGVIDRGNDADVETAVGSNSDGKVKAAKKRRKEKRHSPELGPDGISVERKRKRKKKSFDHENWQVEGTPPHPQPHVPKIKIKTITPSGEGQTVQTYVASAMTSDDDVYHPIPAVSGVQLLPPIQSVSQFEPVNNSVTSAVTGTIPNPTNSRPQRQSGGKKTKVEDLLTQCDQCQGPGSKENLVRCDECQKCYHFHCLDPPVKKSPKIRGYSWHCADCDPSDSSTSSKK
ncbi:PHD finger protein 14 [Frankliniella occidentalis]|uniref:PHD finger protein 14 n=1 Tax=Frankliniella occidentalis TaxID=133901 RepID=A0A6J1S2S9_FRAOC|nr:PHD finger protein 14 [Frankliniella occidentalis]